jgi:hypothetical protein
VNVLQMFFHAVPADVQIVRNLVMPSSADVRPQYFFLAPRQRGQIYPVKPMRQIPHLYRTDTLAIRQPFYRRPQRLILVLAKVDKTLRARRNQPRRRRYR